MLPYDTCLIQVRVYPHVAIYGLMFRPPVLETKPPVFYLFHVALTLRPPRSPKACHGRTLCARSTQTCTPEIYSAGQQTNENTACTLYCRYTQKIYWYNRYKHKIFAQAFAGGAKRVCLPSRLQGVPLLRAPSASHDCV